ncbi:MAG: hypothetical protein WA324_07380 [Bryobacteraceae bacterium]
MTRLTSRRIFEASTVLLFLAAVIFQAFWPKPFGLADNGDFPKVLGRIGAWPPSADRGEEFTYFISDYDVDSGLIWDSHLFTTEVYFAKIAKSLDTLIAKPGHFDLRSLGLVHLCVFTLAFWLILRTYRLLPMSYSIALGALTLLIFADVEYLEFLNTPLMDAASMTLLVLLAAVVLNLSLSNVKPKWTAILAFGLCAAAFLGTKLQHQPCLVPLLLICAWGFVVADNRKIRSAWIVTGLIMVAVSAFMVVETPAGFMAEPRFSLVFLKLTALSSNPESALSEIGRPASDKKYIGMHAYAPGTPLSNRQYREQFWHDVGMKQILGFYLHHPIITSEILWSDLCKSGADIPVSEVPVGLSSKTYVTIGVYRKSDNPVGHQRPHGLAIWSTLRRFVAVHIPLLTPLVVLSALVWSGFTCYKYPRQARRAIPLFLLSCIAILSFLTGSLGDGVDTSRHMLTYQIAVDLIVLFSLRAFLQSRPPTRI